MNAGRIAYWWVALALLLYLFFSLKYIELPGLQYDEVNFINASLGGGSQQFIAYSPKFFGKRVPLMVMSYIGALKSGIYAPIFRWFGISAAAVRLPVVCIGLITLLVSAAVFKRMFDWRICSVGILLLAADATFIFSNKLDWGPVSLMLLLEVSSLYCMWRWIMEGKRSFLGLAGLLFGLGLYNKIIFAWYIAAFFISMVLFFRRKTRELLVRRNFVCFVAAFALGCLPLLAYNIRHHMATFRHEQIIKIPGIKNLSEICGVFRGTLDAGGVYYLVNQSELAVPSDIPKSGTQGKTDIAISALAGFPRVQRSIVPLALVASLVLITILWITGRLRMRREILFVGSIVWIIAALICLTPEARGAHHVIAIYPFLFLLIAYAICELGHWLSRTQWMEGFLICACITPLLFSHLVVDARYLRSFIVKGGVGYWSDAIYELASFANANPDKTYVLMEWGFTNQLILLSKGQIRWEDFGCDAGSDPEQYMESFLTRTNYFLVLYAPPFGNPAPLDVYKRFLDRHHLQGRIRRAFFQRDGMPVYLVYETVQPTSGPHAISYRYMRQAEEFDAKSGGAVDLKDGALNKKCLGGFWGRQWENFALYTFTLPRTVLDAHLNLRYAFEKAAEQRYYLFLDGRLLHVVSLPSSRGFGHMAHEWKLAEVDLGDLSPGTHELKLKPAGNYQEINLDYFEILGGLPKPQAEYP